MGNKFDVLNVDEEKENTSHNVHSANQNNKKGEIQKGNTRKWVEEFFRDNNGKNNNEEVEVLVSGSDQRSNNQIQEQTKEAGEKAQDTSLDDIIGKQNLDGKEDSKEKKIN